MPTVSYASGRTLYLAAKLTPGGTLTVTSDPGPSNGRLYFVNDEQVEWVEYTSKTLSGTNYVLGGLTRDIDPVAIPASSNSTGKTWLATQQCVLVAMHDQLWDRQQGGPFASFTTAQLTARTNKQVGETFFDSTLGSLVYWTGAAYQSFGTGTFVNATATSSGGVELGTQAEVDAGTDSGSVGPTVVQPSTFQQGITNRIASQAVAEAGTENTKLMTPLRTRQSESEYTYDKLVGNDSSDGDVTVSTEITLTRDMFYGTLTITGSGTINTDGYRIFCTSLANSGIIRNNGANGSNASNASSNSSTSGGAGGA